ncbi:kelch repeat and BTB domain-containing protein 8-like [Glandiceps talaboti]
MEGMEQTKALDDTHSRQLLGGLRSFYEDGILTDVQIVVENQIFACHRNVLAACSPYFKAMFTGSLCETLMNKIELQGVDALSMKQVLAYMYSADISMDEESVEGLLQAAHMFQMQVIEDRCASYLERHLHVSNCIGVYNIATLISHTQLKAAAWDFINLNFKDLIHEEEFLQVTSELMSEVLISSNLNIPSEEMLYEALLTWYEHDPETRKHDLWKFFLKLRLGFMKLTYICQEVRANAIICESDECMKYIDETILGQSDAKMTNSEKTDTLRLGNEKRLGMVSRQVLIMAGRPNNGSNFERKLLCLDPDTSEQTTIPYPPKLTNFGASFVVTENNEVYAAAIHHQDRTFYQYNPIRKTWIERSPMLSGRTKYGFVYANCCVYAIGGENAWEILDTVEKYDPLLDEWSYVASMPREVMDLSAVSHKHCIYIFSGSRTMCYDIDRNSWVIDLPPMQSPRFSCGVALHQNEIWVIGGENDDALSVHDVEVFDPELKQWWFSEDLFSPLKQNYPISFRGQLYVCVLSPGFRDDSGEPILDGSKDWTVLKVRRHMDQDDILEWDWETVDSGIMNITYHLQTESCFVAEVFFE